MAKIVLDGIARDVVVERSEGRTVVSVDGRRYAIGDVSVMRSGIVFSVDLASHIAWVSTSATGSRISLHGRTYLRTDARTDEDRPSRGATGVHDGRVEAPMPGVIIALHVGQGDRVKAGASLVVLESMKMHNEITAPIDGVIRRVNCNVGDQVSFGHVLAEIGTES